MIVALLIGRAGSRGLKRKNILKINKKFICEYPLIAAKNSKLIKRIYVSTDCKTISKVSKKYGAIQIKRPKLLANSKALAEDVYKHAYENIKARLKKEKKEITLLVLLMANAATITTKIINRGIRILRQNKKFDSAVSTSIYNMWSPLRARKLKKDGTLIPFVPFKHFGNVSKFNCDRDSQGDVYYADMAVSVVRPKCLENIDKGLLPQRWMGKKIASIFSEAGFDLDFEWQIPQLKYWINKYGKKIYKI